MMRINLCLLMLALLLGASRCNETTPDLNGTRWKVTEIRQPNASNAQLPTKDYVLEFRDNKSVGIKLDINNCFGNYEIADAGKISIQPLACTKACCDSDLAMQIISLLPHMTDYQIKGTTLSLTGAGRVQLLRVP